MNNDVIVLLFIGILLLVGVMKYKEGMESSNPQIQSNEHQGTLTNLHNEIERVKQKITLQKVDNLDENIKELAKQTHILKKNVPDKNVKKYRS
jgi:hypothetical protein